MSYFLIGCPVVNRGWILDRWFENAVRSARKARLEPGFVFVAGASSDNTDEVIEKWGEEFEVATIRSQDSGPDVHRVRNNSRYETMTTLRNLLLAEVRRQNPDSFLSLDSDILLHEDAIARLYESAAVYDAVGGRCYMTPRKNDYSCPSFGEYGVSHFQRGVDGEGVWQAGYIMAIKYMNRSAYWIDYEVDNMGEDIGWSKACARARLSLGWDGRVKNKHVVLPAMLEEVDPRVGF